MLAAAKVRKKKLSTGRGKTDKTTPYTVDDLLTRAEECMDSFQLELACKFCERALEIDPSSVRVLDTLGPLLLETGETDRAIEISSLCQCVGREGVCVCVCVCMRVCMHADYEPSICHTPRLPNPCGNPLSLFCFSFTCSTVSRRVLTFHLSLGTPSTYTWASCQRELLLLVTYRRELR